MSAPVWQLSANERAALDVARYLAQWGIPLFVAQSAPNSATGFALPSRWQQTLPDPSGAVVEHWRPGMALCAVMGQGIDLVDLDPRNGGTPAALHQMLNGVLPMVYAAAVTPSGGWHLFIRSLGVRSHDDVHPGIDYKGGDTEGQGRGFAFLAPTVRTSKITKEPTKYAWIQLPDLSPLGEADTSGALFAEAVRKAHTRTNGSSTPASSSTAEFMRIGPWTDVTATLVKGRNKGVFKLASALRGRGGWEFEDALTFMKSQVWPKIDQTQSGDTFGESEFEKCVWSAFYRYPDGTVERAAETNLGKAFSETAATEVPVSNPADCVEWLRAQLGKGALSGIFVRGGWLVHTPRYTDDDYTPLTGNDRNDDGPAQVRKLSDSRLASYVQCTHFCYRWTKATKLEPSIKLRGMFPKDAARVAVDQPLQMPYVRPLMGVIHVPIVRADGSLLTAVGYDSTTRLLHLPDSELQIRPIPDSPTRDDVAEAVRWLDYMTAGFDFTTPSDRANYYGLLLTPLLRELAPPPYKLGAIDAPQPGSGKSLLARIVRILHGGVSRIEVPRSRDEWNKSITSILETTTAPVVVWDNVTGILRSSVLSGLLSEPKWDDRILGESREVHTHNDRLWMITGNNVNLGGDLKRRTLWVQIDPGVPNPQNRTDFVIKDLEQWVQQNRGELLRALLVLIRGWAVVGQPQEDRRTSDGYTRWISTVNGILTYAGVPGRFDDVESQHQTEAAEDEEMGEFIRCVAASFGVGEQSLWTCQAVITRTVQPPGMAPGVQLPLPPAGSIPAEALPGDLTDKLSRRGSAAAAKSLGYWLRNHQGRWTGGYCVRKHPERDSGNATQWYIEPAKTSG